jgi:membrane protease subunit HflK
MIEGRLFRLRLYDSRSGRLDWPRILRLARRLAIAALIVLIAFTSVFTVAPDGKAVVKRFGRFQSTADPGLHMCLPLWIDTATFVPTERVLKEEFGFRTVQPGTRTTYSDGDDHPGESMMLTGDLNVIEVEWVVQYRIRDAERWLHRVRDRRGTIRDVAEAVMRRVVGNRLASDVLTVGRAEIATQVRNEMQDILAAYDMGLHVNGVELQDVTPPDQVKPAFNQVNEARQQRERLVNLAEKERNQVLPRARGEAAQTIAEAEAYAAARVNEARGESARFLALHERYAAAPDVTRRRLHLETLDELGPKLGRIYVIGGGAPAPLPLLSLPPAAPGEEGR